MANPSFLLLFILPLYFKLASSTVHLLTKGSSLLVEKQTDFLISPNGIFSAGFYGVGDNAYSFSIWYTKPCSDGSHTTVWMANRDQPVNGKLSKLSLLQNGSLVLTDANQFTIWSAGPFSDSWVELHILNSGNLVLRAKEGRKLWQSFDSPTDTLLPGQPLKRHMILVSSKVASHFSGYYKLMFTYDNVLRLVFDSPEKSSIYWPDPWLLDDQNNRSRYNDTKIAVFDTSGHFASSDRVEFQSSDYGVGPQRRLTLDFDGNLRLYSFEEKNRRWSVTWQAFPEPCMIHEFCGPNSLCSHQQGSDRKCSCPPGFKMKNKTDLKDGCKPEFNDSCKKKDVGFLKLPRVDFIGYNYHILRQISSEMCAKKCLELCCKGFRHHFKDGNYSCYLKRELRNGHVSPYGGAFYLKLPKSYIVSHEKQHSVDLQLDCSILSRLQLDRSYYQKSRSGMLKILLWCAGVIGWIEIGTILLVLAFLYKTRLTPVAATQGYLVALTGFKRFTYAELKKATQHFTEEIGRGASGTVYKGKLDDGRIVAVKRLNDASKGEEEFLAEVSTIGRLNHMHLIQMWGYCAETKHRLLVYEYMEHGSLAENILSRALKWEKRFDIALGTAKGLAYLHEECLEWVLHCDVKPQNILLDSNHQPKVADFGLSKLFNRGNDASKHDFSKMRGTRGYMAPEWASNLPITSKVDVYSYGLVLLEMVTGRKPTMGDDRRSQKLVAWVRERKNEALSVSSWLEEIVDLPIDEELDINKLKIMVEVAILCTEEDMTARPTMTQVTDMLLQIN